MKKLKIYIDTSVIGGCFDYEFSQYSTRLISMFEQSVHIAVVSELTLAELANAPEKVQTVLNNIPTDCLDIIEITEEIKSLSDAYINETIITIKSRNDALHIAAATVMNSDLLLSWNFKHIVNYHRIHLYNSVNLKLGYQMIEIYSPMEVVE